MEYKVKSYSFLKIDGRYVTFTNGNRCEFSAEMFDCMKRQYILMGYKVFWETDAFISLSKIENEIEIFLDRLNKR